MRPACVAASQMSHYQAGHTTDEHSSSKRLSSRRGTARRAMTVEILSTAAHLYEKSSGSRRPVTFYYCNERTANAYMSSLVLAEH